VTFVYGINVNNNVDKNKIVFSADDRVLIKLLRQEKKYGAKTFIAEYPANLGHSEFNKLLQKIDTDGHFTLSGDLTKAAVAIVCIG